MSAPLGGEDRGLGQRLHEVFVGPHGRAAPTQPAGDAHHGHADREPHDQRCSGDRRQGHAPQRRATLRPGGPRPDPCVPAAAPGDVLDQEERQAADHQHPGQRRRGRTVEGGAVLLDDRGRERLEAHDREGAVLREQVQPDEERSAQDREPQLRQDHAPKHPGRALTEAGADLLQRGIETSQRRHDREVDQREVGQRGDQDAGRQARHRWDDTDPAVARDEGGDHEGRGEQDGPRPTTWQLGSLDQPCGPDAERHARGRRQDEQSDGVHEELEHPRTEGELDERRPSGLHRDEDDVQQRDQRGRRNRGRRDQKHDREVRPWRPSRSDQAGPHASIVA